MWKLLAFLKKLRIPFSEKSEYFFLKKREAGVEDIGLLKYRAMLHYSILPFFTINAFLNSNFETCCARLFQTLITLKINKQKIF